MSYISIGVFRINYQYGWLGVASWHHSSFLSKDKVPHRRLLLKFKVRGIGGRILDWTEDWPKGRRQTIVLNCLAPDWPDVLSGVPQGSVLVPLLFVIYIYIYIYEWHKPGST